MNPAGYSNTPPEQQDSSVMNMGSESSYVKKYSSLWLEKTVLSGGLDKTINCPNSGLNNSITVIIITLINILAID